MSCSFLPLIASVDQPHRLMGLRQLSFYPRKHRLRPSHEQNILQQKLAECPFYVIVCVYTPDLCKSRLHGPYRHAKIELHAESCIIMRVVGMCRKSVWSRSEDGNLLVFLFFWKKIQQIELVTKKVQVHARKICRQVRSCFFGESIL